MYAFGALESCIYSGEGKLGNQTLTKGNLAIKNAASDGKEIHLFVKFSPQEYYYQGVFELVDYTYEDDYDANGNIRKEYKFRLREV
jgi:5-methylcytosine-specific restriction protein A